MRVKVVLLKRKDKKRTYHLLYKLGDIVIDATDEGILAYPSDSRILKVYETEYTNEGCKTVYTKCAERKRRLHRPSLYNCISVGQNILGIKGIFLSCPSFFNKIKGV